MARPPTRRRLRSSAGRISGCATRRSVTARSTSSAAPSAKPPMVRAEVQPCSGAPMSAQTSETAPRVAVTAPTMSNRPGRRGVSLDEARVSREHGEPDRHVDEQRPAPRAEVGDGAAEQQPQRHAARGDRAEERERPVAGRLVGGAGGEQGEHAGCGHRGADALQARGRRRASRGSARGRRAREARVKTARPISNMRRRPKHVAEPAAEQQQAAEGEGVGVQHPGEPGRAEAEVGVDPGERDVHDGRVEDRASAARPGRSRCPPRPGPRAAAGRPGGSRRCTPAWRVRDRRSRIGQQREGL